MLCSGTGARGAFSAAATISWPARLCDRVRALKQRRWPPLWVQTATRSNRHALRGALSDLPLPNPLILDARSNSVRRVISGCTCAEVPATGRRSSSSTSRRWTAASASSTSSTVRRCGRATWRLLHAAEPCAAARVAGPLSPCPSTLCMIPAATDIYGSVCTRSPAGMWPPEVVVRSESAPRARCACVPMRQTISHVR